MASIPTPFQVTGTKDEAGGMVLQVGIDPKWAQGFRDGIEAAMAILESHSPNADEPEVGA
jgi:hypothetical protein